jgi:hypothetical protein
MWGQGEKNRVILICHHNMQMPWNLPTFNHVQYNNTIHSKVLFIQVLMHIIQFLFGVLPFGQIKIPLQYALNAADAFE